MPRAGRRPYRQADIKLEEILFIDDKGVLTWKVKWGRIRPNTPAGRVYNDGRFMVKIRGKFCLVEDIVWLLTESRSNSAPVEPKLNESQEELSDNNSPS